ncbi:hypothetical protein TNCV_1525781 [Trichonephila clavipes]|nr:hypothetical protein TNCV_1525781 [Trichonephila clavipes]
MPFCGGSCHNLCKWAVNIPVIREGCSCFQANPRRVLLVTSLVPWQVMEKLGGRTRKILRSSSVALNSKNQEINRLQLAVKLPWAIFFESVDILS